MWRKLGPYWQGARGITLLGVLALLVAIGIELLLPWPVKWLVDYVLGSHPVPTWAARIWPEFAGADKTPALLAVCLAGLLIAVAFRVATFVSQLLLIRVGGSVVFQLRARGYEQFCRLPIAYHDRTKLGDSLYRIAYDTQAAMTLISSGLVPLFQGLIVLAAMLVIMARMDPFLTLIVAAIAPILWICIRIFSRRMEDAARQYHENESLLLSTVQESLSSMRAVQAFTREPDTSLHFRTQAQASFVKHLRTIKLQLAFSGTIGLVMAIGTAAAIWFGAQRVFAGQLLPGDVLVFLAYLAMLYQPVQAFSQSASVLQTTRVQLSRVFEVLDLAPEIADRPTATAPAEVRGHLAFERVVFCYEPPRPTLQGIDLQARRGDVIALVGASGAGKTTLVSLLLRFYDPEEGRITLDARDLRDLPLAWLRKQVSVVLQDALLLSGTVRDNIAYGRPNATFAEIEEAARKARANDFIRALPDGYETNLAEHAVNLSGGQKQRLAIARAFLKDAPILVLDEPTSALDAETEHALLEALQTLTAGRTTFIIAHRFSTIRLATRIIVLHEGRIVEQGSHDELMAAGGHYRGLYLSQTDPHHFRTASGSAAEEVEDWRAGNRRLVLIPPRADEERDQRGASTTQA
jgi:ATP-binding cassette subfamily B protein/subfamily B ATP-binding cassette protein MsbA